MVAVCFWGLFIILMLSCKSLAKSKEECPDVCKCLGTYVDCSSRKLERLPSMIPKWATHLDLHNNSVQNFAKSTWNSVPNLTELKLNKNFIQTIPKDCFLNQKQLKILELNRNRLTTIEPLSFKGLERLTSLKLKRNNISVLSDGAFYGLLKIEKLLLDYNFISTISKKWLYGLENLRELSLSHNNINKIEPDGWEFCVELKDLDLSYNRLASIGADTFKNLGGLQKLILNNNNISNIKENAFEHLPKLKILLLHNNKISWAIEDANGVFRGLNDLLKFNLAGNNIKAINKNAFAGLKNVTYLNLDHNNITSIQKDAFVEVPSLKDLVINTTSLICDCNIKWLFEWVNANTVIINAHCAYPHYLQGRSLFNISLEQLTCDELPKPRLIEQPDAEIMALKGENVSLTCKAISSSNSIMTFQWKKDNMEIPNSEMIVNSATHDKTTIANSTLHLRWVTNSNAGKYQCVVSNNFGATYSHKSIISVLVFPTFVKRPQNITVIAGQTARLECAANGEPQPEIGWKKDGGNDFPAARERRMEYMTNDDVFFILDAKESDMGVYSCTAHNAAGTTVANASLIIEEKPSFVKAMEDKEVVSGHDVALQCMASGRPKPTVTWLKDGTAITATDRHFFTAEDQLMIIVDTVVTDSGIYECHLNNSLGEVSGHSSLVVKSGDTYASTNNMLGIIIITVVCCAVLTSIIWVVIIYKTRKRPSNSSAQNPKNMTEFQDKNLTHLRQYPDNISDHSSCKDSGTGDSAKRSSDDLAPEEFMMIITESAETTTSPLLHTNHDRAQNDSDLSTVQAEKNV